ncbi:methionine ABC transporter ATP-binding protein [Propionibacteriaceae bacterium G1746]|uniref:methionine ABC transporter ATP-binding protein n=1 Tax=Aestuariimicrobium sp. G57 TaxID=3418485 RepID=UPI003C21CAC6
MTEPIITLDGVHKRFEAASGNVHAVNGVNLDIYPGEIFGVIGFSGAGKSTLVRLINGLEPTTSGRLTVNGHEVSALREKQLLPVRHDIGMIFQQFNLFSSKTVADNVAYPLHIVNAKNRSWDKAARDARVAELLAFVGLSDKAKAYPAQLSGGQKQRVGIARALAANPRILLADECTSALDPQTTDEVLDLLRRANSELGVTIVIITHEMDVVRNLCHRVAVMEAGKVIEQGEVYDIFSNPTHPTTRRFVNTSLKDRPTEKTLERLSHHYSGRLVTVTIRDRDTGGRTVVHTLDEAGVRADLVYGSIVEITDRPYGSLTFALTGTDDDIDHALGLLRDFTDVEEHDAAGYREAQR